MESVRDALADRPAPKANEGSLFLRQNDYWTIRHRGRTACLKATRGLQCLALLLRHPGREFHVSELLASVVEAPVAAQAITARGCPREARERLVAAGLYDGCPRLDAQAKAEYQRRLDDLRHELNEAEQFNDPARMTQAQDEMSAIAHHLASAVGLGGRDRKTSSEAERARCAVTKRIKQSIQKIAEAIPDLGHHLTVSIKTGYFCSYSPHQDRPVAWKFGFAFDR
jgi:non-specific serine/threonine protein kinase